MTRAFFLLFLTLGAMAFAKDLQPFEVQLNSPSYRDGVLTTNEGGLICSEDLRIQAREIIYTKRPGSEGLVHEVLARGDLMVDYGGRVFVGSEVTFDFVTRTGVILDGKTAIDAWFIGGDQIALHEDGSISICGGTITTSDSDKNEWEIRTRRLSVDPCNILTAKDVSFRVYKIPILWLPGLKSNLSLFIDPPVRYKITWDSGQGPRLTLRYRFYSSDTVNLFFRFDARTSRGFGGALEGTYRSLDRLTTFLTKNYLAHDTFYNDNNPNKKKTRFRLQGLYDSSNEKGTWESHMVWDKISDKNMPGDFKSDDFEVNTAKRTQWLLRNIEDRHIAGLNVRARINSFQGFKQELPNLKISLRPFEWADTGIISENQTKSSYLDYVYSDEVDNLISDFHSIRLETDHQLYRPINLKIATLTPQVGFTGIFYNNSQDHRAIGQAIFHYGGTFNLPLERTFATSRHFVEPYLCFQGLSNPTFSHNEVLIFDIQDGYNRLNLLKIGLRNHYYTCSQGPFSPQFSADLYGLAFFSDTTFSKRIPKAYADLECNLSRVRFFANVGWNFQENLLDRANLRFLWTLNEDFAFSFEFRHRSRFDWRKDNHDNYIVDVTQPIEELLHSPLSDGRNTFLAKAEIKLTPSWTMRLQSHTGWGRAKEPSYTETKLDLFKMIATAWRLRLSYMHTVRTDQVTFGLTLVNP